MNSLIIAFGIVAHLWWLFVIVRIVNLKPNQKVTITEWGMTRLLAMAAVVIWFWLWVAGV